MSLRPARNVFLGSSGVCWRCSSRQLFLPTTTLITTRSFSQTIASRNVPLRSTQPRLKAGYFVSNDFNLRNIPGANHLPHRRRQRQRNNNVFPRQDAVANASNPSGVLPPSSDSTTTTKTSSSSSTLPPPQDGATEQILPPNASSLLTTASTKQSSSIRKHLSLFLSLSKPRLTVLVVLTAMAPYALYPVPDFLSPSIGLDTPSLSPLTLAFLTTGTALCSASANALNMLYEPAWDAMMSRTRNRPLVRGLLSRRTAFAFAIFAAVTGVGSLYFGVNPTVAMLGAANIALYAGVYTPLKRISWLNTWAGAVVGGIPPLMGWAAAAGEYATDNSSSLLLFSPEAIGGWLFAALLFAWQFPHFMALSWSIRDEYKAAGHQMLAWVNPARNARVALRYSLAFVPICVALCAAGVTEWSFAVTSLPVNVWLVREAVRFWKYEGFKGSARGLFWASVWHLPAVMVLALVQKKGMWERVWRSVMGEPDLEEEEDDDEYWDDEDEDREGEGGKPIPVPVHVTRR
ncbi:UbiA prenyltransferase family-domain-containing protein [Xylariaceae sp. FL0255]|nr:UbiA prenyltransferase family-domain-containing protein [Xylariaceae sp. FL0255]